MTTFGLSDLELLEMALGGQTGLLTSEGGGDELHLAPPEFVREVERVLSAEEEPTHGLERRAAAA